MTITPGIYDLTIYQGATLSTQLTWLDHNNNPVNLSSYTAAELQARTNFDDATPFINLTMGNGITLGGSAGTVTLAMSAAATQAIQVNGGVYDLILTDQTGTVTRLLQGNVIISKEVSR